MNPARVFGAALVSGKLYLGLHWVIYISISQKTSRLKNHIKSYFLYITVEYCITFYMHLSIAQKTSWYNRMSVDILFFCCQYKCTG